MLPAGEHNKGDLFCQFSMYSNYFISTFHNTPNEKIESKLLGKYTVLLTFFGLFDIIKMSKYFPQQYDRNPIRTA